MRLGTLMLALLTLTACGGYYEDRCEGSAECKARGLTAKTCHETVYAGASQSSWDNGRTWIIGTCADTAPDNA